MCGDQPGRTLLLLLAQGYTVNATRTPHTFAEDLGLVRTPCTSSDTARVACSHLRAIDEGYAHYSMSRGGLVSHFLVGAVTL